MPGRLSNGTMNGVNGTDKKKLKKRLNGGENGVVTKKQKTEKPRDESSSKDVAVSLEKLSDAILESEKNYNNLVTLIEHIKDSKDAKISRKAVSALQPTIVTLIERGRLSRSKSDSKAQKTVIEWLRGRYKDYQTALFEWLKDNDSDSKILALECLLELVVAEGSFLRPSKSEYWFPESLYKGIIRTLVESEHLEKEFVEDLAVNFIDRYGDLTYFTYSTLGALANEKSETSNRSSWKANYLLILNSLNGYPIAEKAVKAQETEGLEDDDDDGEDDDFREEEESGDFPPGSIIPNLGNIKKAAPLRPVPIRKAFQDCWLAALCNVVEGDELKTLLNTRSHQFISRFPNPEQLMDFYTLCYDKGGPLALVALDGLFQLIEKRNLDYPDFYKKLYALFDRDLMHIKYRSHFFRLVDIFLASTHLPGALVASFLKRMARLSLSAPPPAIVTVIPFVYNLLKRHPSCLFMLHRTGYDYNALRERGMQDPFDMEEEDPLKTEAIESCLWELIMLQDHYNPNVARFCRILSEQYTKPSFNTEDFLDHSYSSMMEEDWKKVLKKPVAVEYEISRVVTGPLKKEEGSKDLDFGNFAY